MGRVGGRARAQRARAQVVHAVMGRRRPVPPGGLPISWLNALDRFARSVHRFNDRVEVIADRQLRRELLAAGADLEAALAAVRAHTRSLRAHRDDPGPTVRALLRSGTLCAHATECAVGAAAAGRAKDTVEVARCVDDVRAIVAELVADLAAACSPPPWQHRASS